MYSIVCLINTVGIIYFDLYYVVLYVKGILRLL